MRETLLKCPITGQRQKITEPPDGEPNVLDADDASELPTGWGEVLVRRVLPNPEYASTMELRAARTELLNAQIGAAKEQLEATDADVERALSEVPAQVERDHPLPPEVITVEWSFATIGPEGMEAVGEALDKLGLVMQPFEVEDTPETETPDPDDES